MIVPEEPPPARWKWLLDDAVLVGFAAASMVIAYLLGTSTTVYPPTFISIFLGIAVAAITYRYLGGTDSSKFSIATLKLGGSAALLLGVTWYVGSSMRQERNLIGDASVIQAKDGLIAARDATIRSQQEQIQRVSTLLESADSALLNRISRLDPDDPFIERIRLALGNPAGPGRRLARARDVRIMNNGAVSDHMTYWICADTFRRFYPDPTRASGKLRVTATTAAGSPVQADLTFGGEIGSNQCSGNGRSFDMQISCDASAILFPDLVRACEGTLPRYLGESNRITQASAGVPIGGN